VAPTRTLLARRSITDPDEIAYYICYWPADTELTELVYVAGARWAIEESPQTPQTPPTTPPPCPTHMISYTHTQPAHDRHADYNHNNLFLQY